MCEKGSQEYKPGVMILGKVMRLCVMGSGRKIWRGLAAPVARTHAKRSKWLRGGKQIRKAQDESQWIVAQRLLSALTIPGFS